MNNLTQYSELIWNGTLETLYMVGVSLFFAVIIGLPLGILIVITRKDHIAPCQFIYRILDTIINIGRSIPFIILMVAIIPFTRKLVGSSIGTTAAIVPLAVAAIPFVGRVVESAMLEISPGVIEAARSMGQHPPDYHEGIASRSTSWTDTRDNPYCNKPDWIFSDGRCHRRRWSGDIAIRYGYQRFRVTVMIATVVVLVLLVDIIQWIGNKIAAYYDHR